VRDLAKIDDADIALYDRARSSGLGCDNIDLMALTSQIAGEIMDDPLSTPSDIRPVVWIREYDAQPHVTRLLSP
jgi:hypothetical protein